MLQRVVDTTNGVLEQHDPRPTLQPDAVHRVDRQGPDQPHGRRRDDVRDLGRAGLRSRRDARPAHGRRQRRRRPEGRVGRPRRSGRWPRSSRRARWRRSSRCRSAQMPAGRRAQHRDLRRRDARRRPRPRDRSARRPTPSCSKVRSRSAARWSAPSCACPACSATSRRSTTPRRRKTGCSRSRAARSDPVVSAMRRDTRSRRMHCVLLTEGLPLLTVSAHPLRMRVWIDQPACVGNGICAEICPEVFELADGDIAYVLDGDRRLPGGSAGALTVPLPTPSGGDRGRGRVPRRLHLHRGELDGCLIGVRYALPPGCRCVLRSPCSRRALRGARRRSECGRCPSAAAPRHGAAVPAGRRCSRRP